MERPKITGLGRALPDGRTKVRLSIRVHSEDNSDVVEKIVNIAIQGSQLQNYLERLS